MAISRTPVFKRCDYLGIHPLVLGYTHKPSIRRQKPTRRRKQSEYARQLIEKQKLRFVYGVLERQFKLIYERAEKASGNTGENLITLLELRFDNIVFRSGLSVSRKESRQMINHGHFLVNGKRVSIPSVTLNVGDIVTVDEKIKQQVLSRRLAQNRTTPTWLRFDEERFEATVISQPSRNDIDYDVTESAVVELYSK